MKSKLFLLSDLGQHVKLITREGYIEFKRNVDFVSKSLVLLGDQLVEFLRCFVMKTIVFFQF